MPLAHMQIGEVAERTGLSIRTIRYYGEMGLVEPSTRSQGGFRLYTEDDVQRLLLIREMKPLELSLEQIGELLSLLEDPDEASDEQQDRSARAQRLALYIEVAQARTDELQRQLDRVAAFTQQLRAAAGRQRRRQTARR